MYVNKNGDKPTKQKNKQHKLVKLEILCNLCYMKLKEYVLRQGKGNKLEKIRTKQIKLNKKNYDRPNHMRPQAQLDGKTTVYGKGCKHH